MDILVKISYKIMKINKDMYKYPVYRSYYVLLCAKPRR